MAHIREKVRFHWRGKSLETTALIDTGASTLILPEVVAREIGVEALGETEVELADGTLRKVNYGVVEVEMMGRRAP